MENERQNPLHVQGSRFRHYALQGAKIIGIMVGLAFLVLASWNMFAPDMFGLEAIRMKQALGLVIFASVFAGLLRFGHRSESHRVSQGE
jgi:hypothetical protein